jgi:hypothetical protein
MTDPAPHDLHAPAPDLRSREVLHQARRRRLMRVLTAVLLGFVVGAYTFGALNERVIPEDENDLLPVPVEALIIGAAFTLASLPTAWSIVGRVLIPVPTFYIYLTVLLGKDPPLPFYAAFVVAGLHSAILTALSRDLSERPTRPRLGSSRAHRTAR